MSFGAFFWLKLSNSGRACQISRVRLGKHCLAYLANHGCGKPTGKVAHEVYQPSNVFGLVARGGYGIEKGFNGSSQRRGRRELHNAADGLGMALRRKASIVDPGRWSGRAVFLTLVVNFPSIENGKRTRWWLEHPEKRAPHE